MKFILNMTIKRISDDESVHLKDFIEEFYLCSGAFGHVYRPEPFTAKEIQALTDRLFALLDSDEFNLAEFELRVRKQ